MTYHKGQGAASACVHMVQSPKGQKPLPSYCGLVHQTVENLLVFDASNLSLWLTIGSVYLLWSTPCVTYFNGLGLSFDPSPQVLSSDRHWLNLDSARSYRQLVAW